MNWINQIANGINEVFKTMRPIPMVIPPLLLLCEINNRTGLSAIALTSAIIKRLPEIGINSGMNADGTPNVINKFVRVLVEEMIDELKYSASVETVIDPHALVGAIAPIICKGIVR